MKSSLKNVHYSIKGVNLNRIYKECQKNNIQLFNIDRKDYKNIEFDISYKDKAKLKSIIKLQNYECREEQKKGFNKILNFVKFRFGILIGVIIFLIANIFSSFFVWNIKIYGNQRVNTQQIISILNKNNVGVGKHVLGTDLQNIETALVNEIQDISLCSIIKKGSTIIVNIKEKLYNNELDTEGFDRDIVASCNLTITELIVSNGTALKKVGDSVKKGEIIVAGYVLDANNNKINCKANASIKAKTWHTATQTYQKQIEVATRTGKVSKQAYLTLFGTKYNVNNSKNSFVEYEEEIVEKSIINNFLPFKLVVTKQYEVTKSIVQQNFDADKENILQQCKLNAGKQVNANEQVVKTFDTITEQPDCYTITSYVEVNFVLC